MEAIVNAASRPGMASKVTQGQSVMCPTRWRDSISIMRSRGIFFGEDVFGEHFISFMMQFILFSLTYQVVYRVLRPLKQPKFVCGVLAGVLMGPHVLGRSFTPFNEAIFPRYEIMVTRTIAMIAMTYFIFLVAVKMDVTIIFSKLKHSFWIGLLSLFLPLALVILLTDNIHVGGIKNQYFYFLFAAGLAVSRFSTIGYAFDELHLLNSELGQLVMSSSIVSEVFTWGSLLTGIYVRQKSGRSSMLAMLSILALLLFVLFVLRPLLLSIIARSPEGRPVKEVYVTGILLLALFLAGITDLIGAVNLGVLVFGLIVPDGPPLGAAIVEKAEFFVMEFLMPLFYIVMGYNVDVSLIKTQDWMVMLLFVGGTFGAKFVGALLPAFWCTPDAQHAILVGLMANFKGPFDFFLFNRWLLRGELDKSLYAALVILEVLITAVLSPLVDNMHAKCMRLDASARKNMRAIQTTPDNAEFRILSCTHNEEHVPAIISILEAANPSPSSPVCAYIIQLQELVGRTTPVFISHNKHLRKVRSKRSFHISRAFENYLRGSNGHVKIKTFTMIAPYRSMHETICRLAWTELVPLIIVPFHKNSHEAAANSKQAAAFRNINSNVQAFAPCTVGILVDRGMRGCMVNGSWELSCNVAVLFVGGPDDREALAFGARMLGHPGVKIFMLRLVVEKRDVDIEDVVDRKIDEAIWDEVKRKNDTNDRVSYREAMVDDVAQLVDEVRTLESRFNLIILGRQREATRKLFDEAMSEWTENPELGGIGDVIASPDFKGENTSLLVMQHYKMSKGSTHRHGSEYEDDYLLDHSRRL